MEYIGGCTPASLTPMMHTLTSEVVQAMWDIIQGMRRPVRRQSRMTVIPAMLLGAGLGIATWEVVKRRANGANNNTSGIMDKVNDAVDAMNA